MKAKGQNISINSAKHVGKFKLSLVFSDGHEQIVDFEPFLKKSLHPEIRKFLVAKNFKKFTLQNGDLMWGDFDLIFPVLDLYENNIGSENASMVSSR